MVRLHLDSVVTWWWGGETTKTPPIQHHMLVLILNASQHHSIKRSKMADNNGILAEQELSPLEQEVLDEYDKLSTNMKKVRGGARGRSAVLFDGLTDMEVGDLAGRLSLESHDRYP